MMLPWKTEKGREGKKQERERDGIWERKDAEKKRKKGVSAQEWSSNKGFIDSGGFVCHHLTVGLWCMAASSSAAVTRDTSQGVRHNKDLE